MSISRITYWDLEHTRTVIEALHKRYLINKDMDKLPIDTDYLIHVIYSDVPHVLDSYSIEIEGGPQDPNLTVIITI